MPIEWKDILGWGITGTLSTVSLYFSWRTRQDAKRAKISAREVVWSLRLANRETLPGDVCVCLRLEDAAEQRLRLLNISAISPRNVEICEGVYKVSNSGIGYIEPGSFARKIDIDRDLAGDLSHGPYGIQQATAATLLIFARVPRPASRKAKTDRLIVRLSLEAISARSETHTVDVRSEPIDWAAFHAIEDQLE